MTRSEDKRDAYHVCIVYHFFGVLLPKNKAIEKAAKAIIFHANTIANTA